MVDERFSGEAFEAAGLDTPESRALSDALADAVSREMIGAVSARLREIVVELNRMGHKLQLEQSEPDCVAFRDESGGRCKLRVAADLVISTGYAHLFTPDAE